MLLTVSTASGRIRLEAPRTAISRSTCVLSDWSMGSEIGGRFVLRDAATVFPRGEHRGPNAIGVELDQAEGNYR